MQTLLSAQYHLEHERKQQFRDQSDTSIRRAVQLLALQFRIDREIAQRNKRK